MSWHLVERNVMVYRRDWLVFVSGFFEPLFYLLSIGIGLGAIVGDLTLAPGREVSYAAFVAPAMMASAAVNGAIADATYNVFFKLKYLNTYDALLATPMTTRDVAAGEISWALLRGALYSTAFLLTMLVLGLVESWWALLAVPAAVLLAFAFAAVGMAATTWMRSWQDFEFIALVMLPMFLFSASFFPLSTYPEGVQWVVAATPFYQGVALLRGLCTGEVGVVLLGHVAYLLVMGLLGLRVAGRRLGVLLLR